MNWLIGVGFVAVVGCIVLLACNWVTHRRLRAFERDIGVRR